MPDIPPVTTPTQSTDEKAPPVWGPLLGLLGSQKALVMLLVVIGTLVLVGMGRVTWADAKSFLEIIIPTWFGAHALQDGLSARAKGAE